MDKLIITGDWNDWDYITREFDIELSPTDVNALIAILKSFQWVYMAEHPDGSPFRCPIPLKELDTVMTTLWVRDPCDIDELDKEDVEDIMLYQWRDMFPSEPSSGCQIHTLEKIEVVSVTRSYEF